LQEPIKFISPNGYPLADIAAFDIFTDILLYIWLLIKTIDHFGSAIFSEIFSLLWIIVIDSKNFSSYGTIVGNIDSAVVTY
jgi:hypothetical protein